jgi:Carboxypeptidase regulatory-like domain
MTIPASARVCGLLLGVLSASAAQAYRITGVVVNSTTGRQLSQVHLIVTDERGNSRPREFTTGSDGRFFFDGLPEGSWTLTAERKSYVRQSYGQHAAMGAASSVITGPEGVSEDLTFRLEPPAAIGGKVTDERGEPVPGVHMQLVIQVPGTGRPFYRVRQVIATDDLGEYRIWDIPAVNCYLLAMSQLPLFAGTQEPVGFAPQYYRDSSDPQTATVIPLKPGDDFRADFILRRTRGVSVGIKGDSGIRDGNAAELLILLGQGPHGSEVSAGTLSPGEGRTFFNVMPGRYKLVIGDVGSTFATSRWIDVGSEDVTVTLPFANPPDVTATVRVADGPADLLNAATLRLYMFGDTGNNTRPLQSGEEVRFPAMAAGHYRITLGAPGLYIRSVSARNAKVQDGLLDLPETGPVQLQIVAGADGGHVQGKLRSQGKPLSGAQVVLAPRTASQNPDDYHGYQSDSDGTFDFKAVKPGHYILFASTDWQLDFADPAAIRPYMESGKPVEVAPRASLQIPLELPRR